ncbi:MAG: SgcJ/EcaC family oxidoreductase [Polaromonas sp.]|nr:SgcJ/EcaC family oxidoreductase [Polaromonas sp.]
MPPSSMLTSSSPSNAVTAAVQDWISAFNEHDAAKVSGLYAAEAVLWGTMSAEIMTSADAVRAYFERTFHFNPPPSVSLGLNLVRVFGNTAVASGDYTLEFLIAGQSHLMPARFSFTYRLNTGESGEKWLIVDHHSSLVPAAPPPVLAA